MQFVLVGDKTFHETDENRTYCLLVLLELFIADGRVEWGKHTELTHFLIMHPFFTP